MSATTTLLLPVLMLAILPAAAPLSEDLGTGVRIRHHRHQHQPCASSTFTPASAAVLGDGKDLARKRVVSNWREHVLRRRRQVYNVNPVRYRYTPMQNCAGWTYYQPYPVNCGSCQPVVAKPSVHGYNGPAKTWFGPKYGCACNSAGSELSTCDIVSGQCRCKQHVIGRNCESCEIGYWGLNSGRGCFKCECDDIGSLDRTCDQNTQQCHCKPGIGGLKCDTCSKGYFGFSNTGCKACEYCIKPGHICDPDTGRCVCPQNTRGEACEKCLPNCYGHEIGIGCKSCSCAAFGSVRKQCELRTGQCECKNGYTGIYCDKCAFGYYGYPRCKRCDCDRAGTEPENCRSSGCSCDDSGQCACKANVVGKRCNECSNGTFGLHVDNPVGCTQCFCFGRTAHCTESNLTIGHIRLNTSREFEIDYIFNKHISSGYKHPLHKYLSQANKFLVIPGEYDDNIKIEIDSKIDQAIYWRLPKEFLGDKILSYGGYLRFVTETIGGTNTLTFNKYPLIQLRGNDQILEYYQLLPNPQNRHEIRLHESLWRWQNRTNFVVSRDVLMVVLQKVQHVLIRANNAVNFNKVVLHNVTLDTAIMLPGSPPPLAKGVELCECPRQYNSSSCQNPSIGFYRWYTPSPVNGTIIINLIGEARPCECNGRSNVCDTETGHCLNCTDNTTGPNCQNCSEGFYGNPQQGKCKPCPCPTKDRNFSRKCHRLHHGGFKCVCKIGYSGPKCDSCKSGYFGNPEEDGGSCQPCNCNKYGSASDECDEKTGQCNCRPGMTGKDCSQCESPRHVLLISGCKPCDNCTQWLLDDLDKMSEDLEKVFSEYILYDRVRQLYDKLNEMSNKTIILENKLDKYKSLQQTVRDYSFESLNKLFEKAEELKNRDIIEKNIEISSGISNINNEINSLYNNIDIIKKQLLKTINDLLNFGTSHIEVKNAVKQAQKLLDEIKKIPITHQELIEKKQYCDHIFNNIKNIDTMYNFDQNDIKMNIKDFENRLKDMQKIINKNMQNINEHDEINSYVVDRLNELKGKIKQLNDINFGSIKESLNLLKKAENLYSNAELNYRHLINSTEFDNLYEQLKESKYVSTSELQRLVDEATERANNLQNQAEEYKKSFNISHETDLALKASKRYVEIIDLLKKAKESARNAENTIKNANKIINPKGKNSINVDAIETVEKSKVIKDDAELLHTRVNDLLDDREQLNISISDSKNIIWRTGVKDNALNNNIHNLPLNKKDMKPIIHTANAISNKMKYIYKNATSIKEDIKYKLRPDLDKLKKAGVEIVSLGEEKLSVVERNIKNSLDILYSLENNNISKPNITNWNDTITSKLDDLKSQILKAKQAADGIRVSLSNAENSVCTRAYKPYYFGPTTTTNIELSITLNNTNTDKNYSLFFLQTASKDFMALQLINKHIQYLWNLGDDTGELKIKLPIVSNDGWYKISVERTANIAKLMIYNKLTIDNPTEIKGATNLDFTRFDMSPNDKIWIGGPLFPNDPLRTNQLNTETGIAGCLSSLIFDGKPIGLWNFVNSTEDNSCTNCNKNSLDADKSDNCCYFNGRGYSVVTREMSDYQVATTFIRFDFKTFDENALLFLAVDIEKERFVAVSLINGKVQFHIEYGESLLILTTEHKYNTGNKTSVTANRQFNKKDKEEKAKFTVNSEDIIGNPDPKPKRNSFPNLTNAKYYIGGVPPDFFKIHKDITRSLHTHASFLGCIENIQVDRTTYNPLDETHIERYGVEPSCLNKAIKIIGFEGNGYIEMPEQTLNSSSSFGFVFRSQQNNALLLESVNADQTNNFYRISIVSGKLEVHIKMGKNVVQLTSNKTINDGYYHVVYIKIQKKIVKLRIDDELHAESPIDSKNLNIKGHIFFGGLPEKLINSIKIQPTENLTGTIKDFIFNNKLIQFNNLLTFEKVKIGRAGPLPNVDTPSQMRTLIIPGKKSSTVEKSQCYRIPNYSLEVGAVKFGDSPNSFVQHIFKNHNFWNSNYTIELEFRTFYRNGLIFVSESVKEKNRHHILLTLKDHSIYVIFKGKRKKDVVINRKYDDGRWHHVLIKNIKKKVTLTVDGQTAHGKAPKKMNVANMIYIGNVSGNRSNLPLLHAFRGCMRNLKINNEKQDLITGHHNNVGQCFPHVEIGAYFAGDAYAVYKYNFVVDTQLELQFEFRTSEQNGILLSITEPFSKLGLSLELYNGAVVMMGNMGNNGPSKVETNLSTEYSLCDNRWHKVSILFSKEEMTVNVDGVIRSSLAINSTFMESKIESALYIGGLPDDALLGTLHTRDNFKGCIRNVKIENNIDWTDMDELQNILLNSCPVTDL